MVNDFSFSESPQWPDSQLDELKDHLSISFDGSFCRQTSHVKNSCGKRGLNVYLSAEFVKNLEKEFIKEKLAMKNLKIRGNSRKSNVEDHHKVAPGEFFRLSLTQEKGQNLPQKMASYESSVHRKQMTNRPFKQNNSNTNDAPHGSLACLNNHIKHNRQKSFKNCSVKDNSISRRETQIESSKTTVDTEYALNLVNSSTGCKSPVNYKPKKNLSAQMKAVNEYFGIKFKDIKSGSETKGSSTSQHSGTSQNFKGVSPFQGQGPISKNSILQKGTLIPSISDKDYRTLHSSHLSKKDKGQHLLVHPLVTTRMATEGSSLFDYKKVKCVSFE
jgi:hypothetical protein